MQAQLAGVLPSPCDGTSSARLLGGGTFQEQIAGRLGKADIVPAGVSGFTPAQAGIVQDFVDQLGSRVFTVK